jgi:hypothetical protein
VSSCDPKWHRNQRVDADYFLIKLQSDGTPIPFTMEGSNRFACCNKHLERALKTFFDAGETSIQVRVRKERNG